ncbi:transposase [Clostridium sp.]|uniref:transposase n=1 Tax=Clostridium sp. TaxID=1506 RepID=UPI00261AED78|nr:transposase [Clostridium sp.]
MKIISKNFGKIIKKSILRKCGKKYISEWVEKQVSKILDVPNINAKSRMKSARGAARYIGRYLARPAIAEYKILSYDR